DRPYDGAPAHDFSDAFYLANGIDPNKLIDRLDGSDGRSRDVGSSPHPDFNSINIDNITGGFKHQGNVFYYTVNAKLKDDAFTNDAAGVRAKTIANNSFAYIFPKASGNPLVPAPPNRRQDNLFEDKGGYFSNNVLGLWLLRFVSWDGPNVNGQTCQDMMDDLEEDNGRDLDGTPIIDHLSDIENLDANGCVTIQERNQDGSDGFPWVV
ncbi:MAG: hypothetical protein ACE5K9_10685, partial [Candidatus Methylomirabilales bacterium]